MKRLEGKVAIVTGGALGIGRSACRLMAQEGAAVAVTDLLDEEGQKLVRELEAEGHKAAFFHLDVAIEGQVEDVFARVFERFGRVDVLVNNAGIAGVNKPTDQISEGEWDRLFAVNVKGVFFGVKHAIGYMRRGGGGSIINLSSIYGLVGAADLPPYHASKGAVRLMTKNDALIYAKEKIRVNSIHPGFIWTPLVQRFGHDSGMEDKQMYEALSARHPLGHPGEPDDIGWAVVYLASDESKFMTGAELVVDGGYTAQ
ncbi:MAG: glucose 1-dehydrogenase [Bryobacterales bacterium]|nr:glucose 1-dehydrogenase [Bryobacterales bacterium]